jgi:hypothetical protein
MKTFFCNRTVDKSEMKRLIKWVLLNYGTQKATRFVDHLKTLGFHSATTAGISLGIDDLRIPPVKPVFLKNAEKDILDNDLRYKRGQITAVERLEKALDIWNTTNDTLKNEVIAHFRETDIFNPVYMMAFSGARGNISQVRQLVGMRGLMADQQGQVLDFPIRRNFREGLTVTEYMISCYGARKGLVDTALRTANSGYLTRRLVDVAQGVIIQQFDCETTEGLEVVPSAKNDYANIVGRVLLQPVIDPYTEKYIARKNIGISPALARKLLHVPKVVVRSPLTCRFNSVCQLCYGWDLSKYRLVQLGEAVGVLAAQSIGEPGTQLTMRTFHTGGVFAGEATEKVYAPYSGIISYGGTLRGRKVVSRYGEPAFLTVVPVTLKISRAEQAKSVLLKFPAFTLLFVYPGQHVMFHQSLAELSRIEQNGSNVSQNTTMSLGEKELLAPDTGQIYFDNLQLTQVLTASSDEEIDEKLQPINKVFGYGFIWILSGQLLRTNQSYQGDYFHKKADPFSLHSTVVSVSRSFLQSPSKRYSHGMQKLLTYGMSVRKNVDGHLRMQVSLNRSIGHVDYVVDPSYSVSEEVFGSQCCSKWEESKAIPTDVYPVGFKDRHCCVGLVALKTVSKTLGSVSPFGTQVTRPRGKSYFKLGVQKMCIQGSLQAPTILQSSSPTRGSKFKNDAVTLPAISVIAPFKHWKSISSTFPYMPVHMGYQPGNWDMRRAKALFPKKESENKSVRVQVPALFPKFTPVIPFGESSDIIMSHEIQVAASSVCSQSDLLDSQSCVEGEIRIHELALTQSNQHAFAYSGYTAKVQVGQYIRVGDELFSGMQSPYGGQVIHISPTHIILRRVYPYAMSHNSPVSVNHGELIQKGVSFGALVSLESTAGDIVQGLPKVDELLEAREPVEKIGSSIHTQLAVLFLEYSKTYGLREGCRRSLQEVRQILVHEVQDVYSSQGVFISDKHIEIIVRQMTTYVLVVDPADTNLLPGDIVDLRRVEHFEAKPGGATVQYRPILLGITRASLAAESFISAASFQETKRVLTRAAVEGRIDWLTGLKENVILGRLIPAGTGLYV